MTTSNDILGLLSAHYLPPNRVPGGLFVAEIEAPDGARRADLLWIPTTIASGEGVIIGHEIKCQRSDVVRELSEPAKAESWAQYCSQWWLVLSDATLIDGLSIPEAWGVMAPPSGRRTRSMTIVKDAPRLEPLDLAPAMRKLVKYLGYRVRDLQWELDRERLTARGEKDFLQRQLAEAGAAGIAHPQARRIADILDKLQAQRGEQFYTVHDELIVAAVIDASRTLAIARHARSLIRGRMDELSRILNVVGLKTVLSDLERLDREAPLEDEIMAGGTS